MTTGSSQPSLGSNTALAPNPAGEHASSGGSRTNWPGVYKSAPCLWEGRIKPSDSLPKFTENTTDVTRLRSALTNSSQQLRAMEGMGGTENPPR